MKPPENEKCSYISIDETAKIPPTIIFSLTALRWIKALVDNHSEEIGFFGLVDERPNSTYFIREIFYPKHQLVTAGTCEISPEGETQIVSWLCDHGRTDDLGKLRLWGHSHHTMGVSPSGQDETQALERMKQNQAPLIRVIVNKNGLMDVSFFDNVHLLRFDHIQWSAEYIESEVVMNNKLNEITAAMASASTTSEKLTKISEIIAADPETDAIVEKVKQLKEINVPAPTSYQGAGFTPPWQNGQPSFVEQALNDKQGVASHTPYFQDDPYDFPHESQPWNRGRQTQGQHILTRDAYDKIISRNMKRSSRDRRKNNEMFMEGMSRFGGGR